MTPSQYHGLLVLDKPAGMTSRDAVNRAQHWFPRGTKLGHTGTLDPLATGVLVLCIGAATRLAEYVQQMEKEYRARFDLSLHSETDDLGGTVIEHVRFQEPHPDRATVEKCLQGFIGEIEQVPPAYSAAKVSGQRAYDLARQRQDFTLAPRRVHIYSIELLHYEYPLVDLRVRCGKGTYIRSLARDLGKQLGHAGLVVDLRRTRVGPFAEDRAIQLDHSAAMARAVLLPLELAVLELPGVELSSEALARLRQGQAVQLPTALSGTGEEVAVFDAQRRLVAVAILQPGTQLLRPTKVLPSPLAA